ncbi:MAG: FliA/WhiG family RNA polymerase sigma factor [Halobacteriovoraceae bacterium]|nr:FliA/WhiG family RNA polymerase sigma factor [Halobacteriovoraceae bacterium]
MGKRSLRLRRMFMSSDAKVLEFAPGKLSRKDKEKIVLSYVNVVKIIAKKIYMKLPSNYELDDLISCGMIGLIDAIEKYDPSQEVKFKTYAEYRIRGQILDELRALDWASRATRDKIKSVERVSNELKNSLGRDATDQEVCKAMNMEKGDFFKLMQRIQPVQTFSLIPGDNSQNQVPGLQNALTDESPNIDPFETAAKNNIREHIRDKIDSLPENEGKVLSMYYFEEKTMREISQSLEVTESRVSQLHQSSVARLRKRVDKSSVDAA